MGPCLSRIRVDKQRGDLVPRPPRLSSRFRRPTQRRYHLCHRRAAVVRLVASPSFFPSFLPPNVSITWSCLPRTFPYIHPLSSTERATYPASDIHASRYSALLRELSSPKCSSILANTTYTASQEPQSRTSHPTHYTPKPRILMSAIRDLPFQQHQSLSNRRNQLQPSRYH